MSNELSDKVARRAITNIVGLKSEKSNKKIKGIWMLIRNVCKEAAGFL